jgi:hypothetical protein
VNGVGNRLGLAAARRQQPDLAQQVKCYRLAVRRYVDREPRAFTDFKSHALDIALLLERG